MEPKNNQPWYFRIEPMDPNWASNMDPDMVEAMRLLMQVLMDTEPMLTDSLHVQIENLDDNLEPCVDAQMQGQDIPEILELIRNARA